MTTVQLRTRAWYGDDRLDLDFPTDWDVAVVWPDTPRPLEEADLRDVLAKPVGQPNIRDLARGKLRPVVIVDDLTRPTPAAMLVSLVLQQFAEAGIGAHAVTVVVATGTHGPAASGAVVKKIGVDAAKRVNVVPHHDRQDVVRVGRTSFGTPVFVNRAVANSDFVVGIGGIYPQHSTGFGGGSKLALGVCGYRTIRRLHYRHPGMGGAYEIENDFRRDLDEIAVIIGLRTLISVNVDAERRIVRAVCGDHNAHYRETVEFAKRTFAAQLPTDADVVVSNAYPSDVSLTFVKSKGMIPLAHTRPDASRIVVAACPEGVGHHGLFPFVNEPRFARQRHLIRRARARPEDVPRKLAGRVRRLAGVAGRQSRASASTDHGPSPRSTWLYAPGAADGALPATIPGMTALYSWQQVIDNITREQGEKRPLNVIVYPCAPLQVLNIEAGDPVNQARVEVAGASFSDEAD
jgi:nickel-dependent lactate racemase